nr:unnamed protein product [Digitaria exilis]
MEATALSVGKAVLDGALGYAKSVLAEEIALQLGVEKDVIFITDELEMMLSFLMAADEEQDKHKVVLTWVKQVREVAYSVEDNLMDFSVHSDERPRCWWCIPRILWERRDIAKEVKELRTRVEDVSNRNLPYRLIKGSGSKPITAAEEQPNIASAAMSGIDVARRTAMEEEKHKVDLCHLIHNIGDEDLRVITLLGESSDDIGMLSAIREVVRPSESIPLSTTENFSAIDNNEIQEEGQQQPKDAEGDNNKASDDSGAAKRKFDRSKTMAVVDEVLFGRKSEKSGLIELVGKPEGHQRLKVISVWGMGGIGKTTLVRSVYKSPELGNWKRAWATALRPFNPELLIRRLAAELIGLNKETATMDLKQLTDKLTMFLKERKCLIVLDDVWSTTEWDMVKNCLENATRIIVTTREKEDHKIMRKKLVRRWVAEGYAREMHGMTAEEAGDKYFEELLDRSMILPGGEVNIYSGKYDSCQLHDIMRQICISKAREENLAFTLEDGCSFSSTQAPPATLSRTGSFDAPPLTVSCLLAPSATTGGLLRLVMSAIGGPALLRLTRLGASSPSTCPCSPRILAALGRPAAV